MSEPPEAAHEEAIVDQQRALARRLPADLIAVPRLLGGMISDIRTIAERMAVVPQLLVTLGAIHERVDSLDEEVKRMRAAVESMGGDVGELKHGIDRLEPHLEDVSRVAHPLRRLGRHRGRGGTDETRG